MRAISLLLCAAAVPIVAAQAPGWTAGPEVVARASKQQSGFNYDESRVPAYTLRDTVYGRSPGKPEHLEFKTLENTPQAMDGKATLTRVSIASRQGPRSHQFELTVFLPDDRQASVPVFLLINNRPASNTDPTRKEKSGFWPAEQLIARGYGIAALQYGQLAPDNKDRYRDGAIALFEGTTEGSRPPHAWAAIAAWAWGASRAMDYFTTDRRVDSTRVAVVGHSRGGKAALWAGAEDERFGLVISNESGEGGAALSRRLYGETVARINDAFPHWFTDTYKTFNGREAELPIDQHMLLALAAPRALYVASADEDLWADPRGEFLSLAAASPVFGLWGDPALRADQMPPVDTPVIVGRRGYHVRTGGHNLTPYDWDRFADFADRLWRK
jgi:hypothetical protein